MSNAHPTASEIAARIDHTNLAPDASAAQVVTLCAEARAYNFATVCVHPVRVALAVTELRDTGVAVCGVVGLPTGANLTSTKVAEATACVALGAREIDMVAHAGWVKDRQWELYRNDIHAVRKAIGSGTTLKVIIEASRLEPAEIERAALLCVEAGADFVKTSTGVYGQARIEDVTLLRRVLPPQVKIKAAGGIRTLEQVLSFLNAGADRIGTSAGVAIMREQ
jgi:deoxyribose-phosphate aldolase